jgi:TolB-like protein
MASIVPGYEYDIFISYRQKDNKYDGWVTEFVANLKKEIEATFKEDVSVYFDINPQDGLLETHDVNASLREKLKCLIFIPIISQTYCDPQSFAWQHEFCAFNKLSKEDQFGRDIRLAGGNVASRILPIKIHDLDPEDKTLLENELGGVLRSIEFIYKSAGVNRPLNPSDNPDKNLNKTFYRDQINKVANAVKEIITALKKHSRQDGEISKEVFNLKPEKQKNLKPKIIIGSFFVLALLVLGYFFFPKLKPKEQLEKSIAVLPFRNLSNDSLKVYFCDGFMEEILNNLQRVKEFTVRSRADQYRNTTKTVETIGKEMGVKYLITGAIDREGDSLKVWIKLIDAVKNKLLWSNDYTMGISINQIFSLQSKIAKVIAGELKTVLSPEEIMQIGKRPTENLEAYNYFLRGNNYFWRGYEKQDFEIAIKMYEKAIELDPGFAKAYLRLSNCYLQLNWFYNDKNIDRLTKSKEAIDAAYKIDPELPDAYLALGNYYYLGFLDYTQALEKLAIAEKKLMNNPECIFLKANIYRRAGKWSLAKENYLKAFELDPGSPPILHSLSVTFSLLGEYQEAEKYFKKTISINPTFIEAYWQESFMYLKWNGNTIESRATIAEAYKINENLSDPRIFELNVLLDIYDGHYQKALTELSLKDYDIINNQFYINLKSLLYARIYTLLNLPGKASEYFNSARTLLESKIHDDPDDPRLYSVVGIVYAGLGLKDKAIEAGKMGVQLMPVSKEAFRGVFRAEDLARIYVIVGEYDAALEQIKYLLSIPSRLSVKLLLLDPTWKPLWSLPEFKKIINTSSHDNSTT